MPRLFTALEVPERVGRELSLVRGGLAGARWVDPENYHVTLRFLGDIDGALAREVAAALDEVSRPALDISIEGLDAFGGARPRALIARVSPSPALTELQAEHERIMRRAGLPAEGRKFAPHVTLARLQGVAARAAADWLAMKGRPLGLRFRAQRVVLLSSRASVGGGPYVCEAAYPLA